MPYRPCEIEHRYGERVHILADPLSLTMLARLCAKGTVQPEVNRLVGELYRMLVHEVVAAEFPRQPMAVPTRMIDVTPRGVWRGECDRDLDTGRGRGGGARRPACRRRTRSIS